MESFQVTALQSTINEVLTFRCIISVSCGRPFQLSLLKWHLSHAAVLLLVLIAVTIHSYQCTSMHESKAHNSSHPAGAAAPTKHVI